MVSVSKNQDLTPKAQQTKEMILNTAFKLFAEKGYADTTLRDIAKDAGISLGLTYRYYSRKEDLVLALYERLAAESADEVKTLPKATIAKRYSESLNGCLDHLTPHRGALGSLFAVGLTAGSEMAVLGDRASGVRTNMWSTYKEVVAGATDAPREKQVEQITTLLYASHLLVILYWLQDRSENQQRTRDLIQFVADTLKRTRPTFGLPGVSGVLTKLHKIIYPMFGPAEVSA